MTKNVPLTTEGRVFARQVWREVKRREPVNASVLAGKPATGWDAALIPLWDRHAKDTENPFTKNAIRNALLRVEAGNPLTMARTPNGDFITLRAFEDHTLSVMEGEREEAVVAQVHSFEQGFIGFVVANVSDHALGRFFERATPKPTVEAGIRFAMTCALLGHRVSMVGAKHLIRSDVYLRLGNALVASGNVKLSMQTGAGKVATPWFDCRTVLPVSALNAQQMTQAKLLRQCIYHTDTDIADVPRFPMRNDYVMQVLETARAARRAARR